MSMEHHYWLNLGSLSMSSYVWKVIPLHKILGIKWWCHLKSKCSLKRKITLLATKESIFTIEENFMNNYPHCFLVLPKGSFFSFNIFFHYKWEYIPLGCKPSASWGWGLPVGQTSPPPRTEWQTRVKTLPCRNCIVVVTMLVKFVRPIR